MISDDIGNSIMQAVTDYNILMLHHNGDTHCMTHHILHDKYTTGVNAATLD